MGAETKHCGGCGVTKAVAEFHHYRKGFQSRCKACQKTEAAERYLRSKEVILARNAAWYETNPKQRAVLARVRYCKDPEKFHAATRKWREKNKAYDAHRSALRRIVTKRASPAWADQEAIQEAYEEARYHGLHVDHIVPIRSPLVCGLHVWENLQLLTASENYSTRNLHWPGMPNG